MLLSEFDGVDGYFAHNSKYMAVLAHTVGVLTRKGIAWCVPSQAKRNKENAKNILEDIKLSGQALGELLANEHKFAQGNTIAQCRDYFLRNSLCYVEYPKEFYNRQGEHVQSMEKFLATKSLHVVAAWLGISYDEARQGYGKRLEDFPGLYEEDFETPYVKLSTKRGGERHVTRPRSNLDIMLPGMNIVPISLLSISAKAVIEMLNEGVYELTYFKNNGDKRVQVSTLNRGKLLELYGENNVGFIDNTLAASTRGDYLDENPSRGYITVPEVGASIYGEGVRRVTLSRLISIREVTDMPDMSYSLVDLDGAPSEFARYIYEKHPLLGINPKQVGAEMLEWGFDGAYWHIKEDGTQGIPFTEYELVKWVETNAKVIGTPYLRMLHDYMVVNASTYPNYTGMRAAHQTQGNANGGNGERGGFSGADSMLDSMGLL